MEISFERQLNALVKCHLEEHTSRWHLHQFIDEDDFRASNAGSKWINVSPFFEAINSRWLDLLQSFFEHLQPQTSWFFPLSHIGMGNFVAIDCTLFLAVLSIHWTDYKNHPNKAKNNFRFNINKGIPYTLSLTGGKADESPFVSMIFSLYQTAIMDSGYPYNDN